MKDGAMFSFFTDPKYKQIKFWTDDEKVFNDVADYIARYIDAERWRKQPKEVDHEWTDR